MRSSEVVYNINFTTQDKRLFKNYITPWEKGLGYVEPGKYQWIKEAGVTPFYDIMLFIDNIYEIKSKEL